MKNSRSNSASDFTKTCETENYETTDRKEMISTIRLKQGQTPNFKYAGFSKAILSKMQNLPPKFQISDDEEEINVNWLPDPCFVHLDSMNYPTPKFSFSPKKPIITLRSSKHK